MGEESVALEAGAQKLLIDKKYQPLQQKLDSMMKAILQTGKVRYSKDFEWKITAIHSDKELNAFCLPGGKMYVFTGLIRFLETEDELAGVLAHEIAHADARHGATQLAKNFGLRLVLMYLTGTDAGWVAELGANLLQLAFSRNDEEEADRLAVRYLFATGYDPRSVGGFFEKMKAENKGQPPAFLSTHPSHENRVALIDAEWKKLGGQKLTRKTRSLQRLKNLLP
jgi:predicted Zn-dependent protease